ncbi:MAG: hypothetical protein ACRD0J_11255 [Acidimicrobiales bacterium]
MSTKTRMASLAEHYDDADTAEELEGAAAAGDGAPPVRYACPWSSLTAPVKLPGKAVSPRRP